MKPGIYDLPFDEYLKIEAVNNTLLVKILAQSPAHAKVYLDNPPEPTQALLIGSVFHTLVLQPTLFDRLYVIAPKIDKRTKAGKGEWAEFEKAANGRTIIEESDYDLCWKMRNSVLGHPIASRFLRGGKSEQCLVWEIDGVKRKGLVDYLLDDTFVDLKSTVSAHPVSFARMVVKYHYHQQAAFYNEGLEVLTGEPRSAVLIAVEKSEPYPVSVFELSPVLLAAGWEDYQAAMKQYMKCVITDKWPAYPESLNLITL